MKISEFQQTEVDNRENETNLNNESPMSDGEREDRDVRIMSKFSSYFVSKL